MANTTKFVRTTFDEIYQKFEENKQNQMKTKEEFLIELERIFDNSSWEEISDLITQATNIHIHDDVVDNIVAYVKENNKISFKQWKVLRLFIKNNSGKKYKYGR